MSQVYSSLELELGHTDGGTTKILLEPFNINSPAISGAKNYIMQANAKAATLASDSTTWVGFTTNNTGAMINKDKAIVGATVTTKDTSVIF